MRRDVAFVQAQIAIQNQQTASSRHHHLVGDSGESDGDRVRQSRLRCGPFRGRRRAAQGHHSGAERNRHGFAQVAPTAAHEGGISGKGYGLFTLAPSRRTDGRQVRLSLGLRHRSWICAAEPASHRCHHQHPCLSPGGHTGASERS